ncbi:MAG: nicotinate phosphoribosyltransferase [Sumerlaeia bacterium]
MLMTQPFLPALLTDLYQFTMSYGYWKAGRARHRACFHLFFRRAPFGGAYALAAGLDSALDFLSALRFDSDVTDYLRSVTGSDGRPIFEDEYLRFLRTEPLDLEIDAVSEGTPVFSNEPLLRVVGPMWLAQIVETPLLNIVNFQTLIATKAARVRQAAGPGGKVLEFGLRRAQGQDGGLSAARAAMIGGCDATSNALAGKLLGVPVKGTHAHSWVMSFDSEEEAFETYVKTQPNNTILLVDTYDTLEGVRKACAVGERLRERGHELAGVRLDSGDLGALSKEARIILDAAGFPNAQIVASSDLDEYEIARLRADGAPIDVWGVGTRLATGGDQAALGGVYKLAAIDDGSGWRRCLKLSSTEIITTNPGIQQVRRWRDGDGTMRADGIGDVTESALAPVEYLVGQTNHRERFALDPAWRAETLLEPVWRGNEPLARTSCVKAIAARARAQLASLPEAHRRLDAPEPYFTGLTPALAETKATMIANVRERATARKG